MWSESASRRTEGPRPATRHGERTAAGFAAVWLALLGTACSPGSSRQAAGVLHVGARPARGTASGGPSITDVDLTVEPGGATARLSYDAPSGDWKGTVAAPAGVQMLTATAYGNGAVVASGSGSAVVTAHGTTSVVLVMLARSTPPTPWDHGPIVSRVLASSRTAWTRQSITLALDALDPDGDPIAYSWTDDCGGAFTAPGSASTTWSSSTATTCTVTGTARSRGLSDSATLAIAVQPDTTPPVLAWSAAPPSSTAGTAIPVDVTASDGAGSGVSAVFVTVNGGAPVALGPAAPGHYAGIVPLTGNASNAITVYGVDVAGNSGAGRASPYQLTAPCLSDSTAPAVAWGTVPPSQIAATSVGLDLLAADAGVGVAKVLASVNGGAAAQAIYDDATGRWKVTVALAANLTNTIKSWAVDALGNSGQASSYVSAAVKSDTSPPTVSWGTTPPSAVRAASLALDVIGTDAVTGVASVWVSVNGGAATQVPYNPSNGRYDATVTLSHGTNTLKAWGIDNVGNDGRSSAFVVAGVTCNNPCR